MKCEFENECLCMTCVFNGYGSCGCVECNALGKNPFFLGDCPNYLEQKYEKVDNEEVTE